MLAEDLAVADRILSRMTGLLGKKELKAGQGLLIRPCNEVHTFFMRFAIDVIFVDKNNKIVKIIPNLKPFRITGLYLTSALVIELPAGTTQATHTQVGNLLSW